MFSETVINALAAEGSIIGYAFELLFPDEPSRTHSGVGDVIINDHLYKGVGDLGGVGVVNNVSDENPIRVSIELAGIPSNLLTAALESRARGLPANLYILVFHPQTEKLLHAEILVAGIVVNYSISAGDENKISVEISDEFELYENSWNEFWTDESHTQHQPNDRICRYVAQMSEREISWGSKRDAPPFKYA